MKRLSLILPLFFIICGLLPATCCLAADSEAASSPETPREQKNAEAEGNVSKPVAPGNEIITRLPNGLLVYIIRDKRFPLVCSRLYVRTGSANEDPARAGISHVLEHMVFKGTSHRPKGEVARDVEALGGYLNAATSFDKTWYLTDMPAEHWKMGMDVLKDMAFQATLDPNELESEKEVVISELQRGEDSPMRKLFENLQTAALHNTPYGRPIIGYVDTIRKLTVDDLRDYIRKWYQPQNMMLLVCGDIAPGEVLGHATALFGNLRNESDLAVEEPFDIRAAADGSEQFKTETGTYSRVYVGIALPVPALANLQSVDLDVLCFLLGGDGTSTFYQKYRYDNQLVDSINVSNMSLARAGMLSITATVDPEKLPDFWESITADLGKLSASMFKDEAIARARFNLEDSMDRAGETLNGLASWKGTIQFDLGGEEGEKNLRFFQQNVDRDQLQSVIDTWFDSSRARVRVLADSSHALPDFAGIMAKNWPSSATPSPVETTGGKLSAEVLDMGNGCQLVLLPDDTAPYVFMDFMMSGGNAMLKPEQQGLAALTARLLSDGCGSMNKPVLERWLSERAASIGASAGLQSFSITLDGPARFTGDLFGLLRDVLRKPKFDPADFQREVNNMKAALAQRNDHPLSYMFAELNPFLFPDGQVYGYDRLGDLKTLDSFNVLNVRDFWARQSGQPWVLAIAGDFNREEAINFAKNMPELKGERIVAPTPKWNAAKKDLSLQLQGKNQAHFMEIFPTVPRPDPDAPALMLLGAILSGQSGILFEKLRDDQGLGYTVTAFNRTMPETGFMAFYIGTTRDKLDKARAGFSEVLAELKDKPLAADVLRSGANRLWGEYLRDRQSLASRAGDAATNAILGYAQNFEEELIKKAREVTPEQLQMVIRKYLLDPYEVTLVP